MFHKLQAGDDQLLADAFTDTRLTVLIGRADSFESMLRNVGDRPDRATFLMTDNSVIDADQEATLFDDAAVVLLDYGNPRNVAIRFGGDIHPTDIVDAVLQFEEEQGHEADL